MTMPSRRMFTFVLYVLTSICAIPALPSHVQEPFGIRTPGTLRDLFLDMVHWDARQEEVLRLDMGWAAGNNWGTPTTFSKNGELSVIRVDEQADSIFVAARIPWGVVLNAPKDSFLQRLTTSIEGRATMHWGGWSDNLIEGFHRGLKFHDYGRPDFPEDEVNIEMGRPVDPAVKINTAAFAFGDIVLRNQLVLWQGGEALREYGPQARTGLSARLDLKIPTGSIKAMGGSGGFDFGVALLGTWQATSWLVGHVMMTGTLVSGLGKQFPMQPRPFQGSVSLSLVFNFGEFALIFEDRLYSPLFESGWSMLDNPETRGGISSTQNAALLAQNQITGGVRWGPVGIWFMEDFTPAYVAQAGGSWFYNNNTPDIAVGVTFTSTLW